MKRTLLPLIALTLSLGAHAQVSDTPSRVPTQDQKPEGYIYGEYAADGETKFATWDGTNWNVYDSDLKLVKTFAPTLNARPLPYTLTKRRKGIVTPTNTNTDEWGRPQSLDEARNAVRDYFGGDGVKLSEKESADKGLVLTVDTAEDYMLQRSYFDYDTFGKAYPTVYFIYANGVLSQVNQDYKVAYTGDWVEVREDGNSGSGTSDDFVSLFRDGGEYPEYNSIYLTQHLFNKDDAYEYLRPVWKLVAAEPYSNDRDGDGDADEIVTSYRAEADEVQIVQDNGTVLQTIDVPVDAYSLSYDLVKLKDKIYLEYAEVVDGEHYTCFRRINPDGATAVEEVSARMKVAARPTIASPAERIVVTLDGKADASREVSVTGADGRTFYRTRVAAGQTSVTIPANLLGPGLNVVNVSGKAGGSCKVIVK